jgi:hypothetical protein
MGYSGEFLSRFATPPMAYVFKIIFCNFSIIPDSDNRSAKQG